jgi:ABC-type phosphate/phosphonate transport system substrate-binding protein
MAFLSACQPQSGDAPTVLHVSAIPDQGADHVRARHQPVMEIVCKAAAIRCAWVDAPSCMAVVDGLGNGSIDQ